MRTGGRRGVACVAQPGGEIDLSAPAAPCEVGFTDGGVLSIEMKPLHSGAAESLPLATASAAPSGAFHVSARVPDEAVPGDWVIRVAHGLPAIGCDDTGGGLVSCAALEAYLRIAPLAADWTKGDAKRRATAVADRIEHRLAEAPGYLGVEVLAGGVQVSLAHPFRDSSDRLIAAAGGEQPSGDGPIDPERVPVVRFNASTNRAELLALLARVERARPQLTQEGVRIDSIRPDFMTGTVEARVSGLSDALARDLSRRFGPALVVRPSR